MTTEQEPKKLTDQQMIQLMDEQTVFSLAVLMMEVYTGVTLKNKAMIINGHLKAGVVLQNNPGFPGRFRAAQKAITDQMKEAKPTASVLVKP